MVRFQLLALIGLAAFATSCGRGPEQSPAGSADPVPAQQPTYEVRGVVRAVRVAQKQVEIRHEAVPGYMPAMTMPFAVRDTNELSGLQPGQAVTFRLTVTETDGWIDRIRRQGEPATNGPPPGSSIRLAPEVAALEVGDPLPNYSLTNQFGQPFSTAEFKGQALAITFLFTRCPFPTFCPLMANHFAEAQHKLAASPEAPASWHLLTVSFDPEFDRPDVLKAYAEAHQYDSNHWTFATGNLMDITALGERFGLAFWRDENGGLSHNLRTVVIDPAGKVRKVFPGNAWTSDELVAALIQASGR